jgi:hypothetical protein
LDAVRETTVVEPGVVHARMPTYALAGMVTTTLLIASVMVVKPGL